MLQKNPNFDEFRANYLAQLSQDRGALFNFFFENNDLFGLINKEDDVHLKKQFYRVKEGPYDFALLGLPIAFFIDQAIIKPRLATGVGKGIRGAILLTEFIGVPILSYAAGKYYCQDNLEKVFQKTVNKYSFSQDDYDMAMNVFEKVHKAGRLNELLDKRRDFDWNTVAPEKTAEVVENTTRSTESL